jgi:hypothetical protein
MNGVEIGQYWVNKRGEVCEVIDFYDCAFDGTDQSYEMKIIQRAWGRHRLGDILVMYPANWREWYQPDSTEIWHYLAFAVKINELHK